MHIINIIFAILVGITSLWIIFTAKVKTALISIAIGLVTAIIVFLVHYIRKEVFYWIDVLHDISLVILISYSWITWFNKKRTEKIGPLPYNPGRSETENNEEKEDLPNDEMENGGTDDTGPMRR